MRLLHTDTLILEEFLASSPFDKLGVRVIPQYAILSHTWGQEELSYQDMVGDRTVTEQKAGFNKVRDSCKQALSDGHSYIWIDTCCIDKTSSAELSEAINSMFKWYKDSSICYAYLSDVVVDSTQPIRISLRSFCQEDSGMYSRWFSRGWTLQELVAPRNLQFFDKNWITIGWKKDCVDAISLITNIDLFALNGGDLRRMTIARRMIWAVDRQTTRVEDTAYCLLGLFNINMPLLYGEGDKAFIRLQEEIMKTSSDSSLFAWKSPVTEIYQEDESMDVSDPQGLLAPTPDHFRHSGAILQFHSGVEGGFYAVSTSKGVQLDFLMCRDSYDPSDQVFFAVLGCPVGPIPGRLPAIRLRRLAFTEDQFTRVDGSQIDIFGCYDAAGKISIQGFDPRESQNQLVEIDTMRTYPAWTVRSIFVKQDAQLNLPPAFWLAASELPHPKWRVIRGIPQDLWDPINGVLQPQDESKRFRMTWEPIKVGALLISFEDDPTKITYGVLILGVAMNGFQPWTHLMIVPESARELYDGANFRSAYPAEGFQSTTTDKYLQSAFDNFAVDDVDLNWGITEDRHIYDCPELGLLTTAELRRISGKMTFLVRLHVL